MKKKKPLSLDSFKPANYNPRKISQTQLEALNKSIEEFGDLSCVVINKKTNTIVAGHQRIKTLSSKDTKIVTSKATDDFGTVAMGTIEVNSDGRRLAVPLRIVDWDLRKEKLANIAANNHGGEFDNQKLGKLLADLESDSFEIESIGLTSDKAEVLINRSFEKELSETEGNEYYSKSLKSPIYEITGKKPKLDSMFDRTKTEELQEDILKAKLPKPLEEYLMAAAERHTKFRFDAAAEYYAHAPKKVQALMEDCALVIVDYDKAIEHGYLRLTDEIKEMVAK